LYSCAFPRSPQPPTLLITGRASRSAPRINEESLSKVTANRTNAQPSPRPTATRKMASARYARSENENRTSMPASLLAAHGRHQTGADDDASVVQDGRLPPGETVGGLVEHQPEP